MELQAFYEMQGEDYYAVLHRMADNEAMLLKYLHKFLEDKTFSSLVQAIQQQDTAQLMQAAHTLKGVSSNLGFMTLHTACDALVNAIRAGQNAMYPSLCEKVSEEYTGVTASLKQILD